jgi:Right handed beta helix region
MTNSEKVLAYCDQIDAMRQQIRVSEEEIGRMTQAIRAEVTTEPEPPEPPDEGTIVAAGDDLQAALDQGGHLSLAAGATFAQAGAYVVRQSGTQLTGLGDNVLAPTSDHALDIPVDVDDLVFEQFTFSSRANEAVQMGVNGTSQNTVDLAPRGITCRALTSIGHRGKRAFDVNAAHVSFIDCEVRDCWSPDGVDSQAICLLNGPGPLLIERGYFEAASENVMVGGDTMKIPDCRPTGITIRDATFTKPLAWQTAGTPKVKNLIELKDGNDVLIENCDLSNSWSSAQDGFGFMFTPSNGGSNLNVVVRNCRMTNVAGIVNIVGTDKSGLNPHRSQITFEGGFYQTNKLANGGRGCFALIGESPEWVIADGCTFVVDGTSFLEIYDKQPVDLLKIVNCTWNYPKYGIRIGGYNHGEDFYGVCGSIVIEGCTISGAASAFKSRYPHNTYVEAYRFGRKAEELQKGVLVEDRGDEGPPRI